MKPVPCLFSLSRSVAGMLSFLAVLAGPDAAAEDRIPVSGMLSLWQRVCTDTGRCPLPVPLGETMAVQGELPRPDGPDRLTMFPWEADIAGYHVRLKFYWRSAGADTRGYLVSELKLSESATGRPVAECTQYHGDDPVGVFFPAGACAGYVPQAGSSLLQVGASLMKPPARQ